jgi:hypothetical protein
VSVRRFLLTLGICCVLFSASVMSVSAAHAQTHVNTTAQRSTVADDTSQYWFSAGFWGYGFCFNHSTISNWDYGSGKLPEVMASVVAIRFPVVGGIAGAVLIAEQGYLEWLDHGSGVCVAWAYGSPFLPVAWSR